MDVLEIDPYLRFASSLRYEMQYNKRAVKVTDCRIFYVTQGQASLTIDGKTYVLEPDCLFYCCAGSQYTINTGEDFSLLSLNFDLTQEHSHQALPFCPSRDPKSWESMSVYYEPIQGSTFLNAHLFRQNASQLWEPVQTIAGDFSHSDPLHRALSCQRLKLLLLELHKTDHAKLPQKLSAVLEYIHSHYAEKLTNKDLADLVGYHEYYLNRLFHSYLGTNLHNYLLTARLNQARSMMLSTNLPLQDISEQVGFSCYPHFSNTFKQVYGCCPAQYRKYLRSSI